MSKSGLAIFEEKTGPSALLPLQHRGRTFTAVLEVILLNRVLEEFELEARQFLRQTSLELIVIFLRQS